MVADEAKPRFPVSLVYSSAQLTAVRTKCRSGFSSRQESLLMLGLLAKHGCPEAGDAIKDAMRSMVHAPSFNYLKDLRAVWRAIQNTPHFPEMFDDAETLEKSLQKDSHFFLPSRSGNRTLVVVFSTMYNNFGVSNLAIAAMVLALGPSVIILKDTSAFNYLRGVSDFGGDFSELPAKLDVFCKEREIEKVFVLGYSSGGFAALALTALMPVAGYIGISHPTDLSNANGNVVPEHMTPEILATIGPELACDLRPRLLVAPRSCKRLLYFGADSGRDKAHAMWLKDVPGVEIFAVSQYGHDVVPRLVAVGELQSAMSVMFSGG